MNIAVIACAALVVLTPLANNAPFRIGFGLVIIPIYFVMLLKQVRRSGLGDSSLGELYSKTRAGHRLPRDALQFAAMVALMLSILEPFKG